MEGKPAIAAMLAQTLTAAQPSAWQVTSASGTRNETIEAWFNFKTKVGKGQGILTLVGGKCRTILTTLQSLDGHEEATGATRITGVNHGADRNRETWTEHRAREEAAFSNGDTDPYCLIIGGGQGGRIFWPGHSQSFAKNREGPRPGCAIVIGWLTMPIFGPGILPTILRIIGSEAADCSRNKEALTSCYRLPRKCRVLY